MHGIDSPTRRRLHALDLNLLVAFDALLSTSSVTRAARELGRTQSATSHALARLRDAFGDPLLVREGTRLVPTPRALELHAALTPLLASTAALFEPRASFEPARLARELVIACPDLLAPLVPSLLVRLRRDAPRARLRIEAPPPDLAEALATGAIDVALGARQDGAARSLEGRRLGRASFAVVARRDHPALRAGRDGRSKRLTRAAWLSRPHVVVRTGNRSPSLLQRALDRAGVVREIGLVVPSFLAALHVVAATELFFAAPREVLPLVAPSLDLEEHPLPLPVPPVPVALFWHVRMNDDPAHAWLRGVVEEVVGARLR